MNNSCEYIEVNNDIDDFVDAIRVEREKGYGFLPLVGAGLSAPSGVPVINEIASYLQKCIAMALGLTLDSAWSPSHPQGKITLHRYRRWLPGRDEWPPFDGTFIFTRETVDWQDRLRLFLGRLNDTDIGACPEKEVYQEAFGAMAEWRSSLLFLARLQGDDTTATEYLLTLGAQDPDIIDTFFLNVVMGKKPTLGHQMLARLSDALRSSIILTTNFDDLLEQAFTEINQPLTAFDVHVDSGLPPLRDMTGKHAIVKLHGGRYGLRADYSLDASPTDEDCRHFVEYLIDEPIRESEWADQNRYRRETKRTCRHLFVIGVSGKDQRILRFIQIARQRTQGLKVYWLSFSNPAGAAKALERVLDADSDGFPCGIVGRHQFFGLFFLQLYQELVRALPSSGAIFPYAPRLPVPPIWDRPVLEDQKQEDKELRKAVETFEKRLQDAVDICFQSNSLRSRVVLVHGPKGSLNGATTAAANVFGRQLRPTRQAIWIDADEAKGTDEFFEMLVHAMSRKAGIVDWQPVLIHKQDAMPLRQALRQNQDEQTSRLQVNEIARITNNPNREWVVFINARTGAGKNLDDVIGTMDDKPNGWLDLDECNVVNSKSPENANNACGPQLLRLIQRIAGRECPNVCVVLLCYENRLVDYFNRVMPGTPDPIKMDADYVRGICPVSDLVAAGEEFAAQSHAQARFLYAMCLTNRPRYLSFLWSRIFHENNTDRERFTNTSAWLKDLGKRHIVRRKDGGFAWMHCEVRNGIRDMLSRNENLRQLAIELHEGFCEAYWRLFLSSDDAMAAFEAIYHQCMRIHSTIKDGSQDQKALIPQWLAEIRHLLELSRPAMLASGFSKGVCRRLAHLRETLVVGIQSELRQHRISRRTVAGKQIFSMLHAIVVDSLNLNRAIAREVGENALAAKRHRTLRAFVAQELKVEGASLKDTSELIHSGSPVGTDSTDSDEMQRIADDVRDRIMHPHKYNARNREPIIDWIASENELGTLGLASRTYVFAEERFGNVYAELGIAPAEPIDGCKQLNPCVDDTCDLRQSRQNCLAWISRMPSDLLKAVNENAHSETENHEFQVAYGLSRTLVRDIQLRLAWGQLKHLNHRRSVGVAPASAKKEFERASACHTWATVVMRHVHQNRERVLWSPYGYHVRGDDLRAWYDERQRLDTQHAVALAYLGDFEKSHRRLSEAEATLRRSTAYPLSMEQAIVELHRAEVLTLQASFRGCPTADSNGERGETPLAEMRREMLIRVEDRQSINSYILDIRKLLKRREAFLGSLACISDAWQALDRAERLLDRQRKNVWWTTWYLDLRMKLVELRVFASMSSDPEEISGILPHLGLEASPYRTPTIADQLLDVSLRMVRLDVFRFAKTVESYAHALLGLTVWRQLLRNRLAGVGALKQLTLFDGGELNASASREDSDLQTPSDMLRRQRYMADVLDRRRGVSGQSAISKIDELRRERDEYDEEWPSTKLSDEIGAYIDHVRSEAVQIANLARQRESRPSKSQ